MGPNRLMAPEKLEKVLEKLAVTDETTLVCEKLPEGKIRVTSSAWAEERVILKDQVLEVRNVDDRLRRAQGAPPRRLGSADPAVCALWAGQSESDFVTGHGAK
jgi:hypothetical protein